MDRREFETRVKALNKAIADSDTSSNILSLIKSLHNEASPTEEMLRATRAGVSVGRLRSNKNKEIATAATQLVAKWKKLVEAEKSAKAKQTSKITSPVPAAAPIKTSTPTSFKGDPNKRNVDTDHVQYQRYSEEMRNNCIKLMYNGLAFRSSLAPSEILEKAAAVEAAAHKHFKGSGSAYGAKMRSLFQNLKNKTNADLGRRVMSGDIAPDKFVVMTSEELKSAELKKLDEELEKQNMKNAQVPQAEKSVSTEFKCGKCGERKVSYSQAQTRSADEPMTTFCECQVCGNRWKFS